MKREEAIKILQPIGEQYCEIANITLAPRMDEIAEAIDMAIDAIKAQLSQEGTTSDLISRQAAIDALDCINGAEEVLRSLPSAHPEPTRIISETRAIPSDDDHVNLSERVTATYYDEENEEWSQRAVTVRDVLDAVCDEYTVLPTIQSEPKEGHWIPHESPDGGEQYECSECGVLWEFTDGTPEDNEAYFCPKCGTKMKGVKHERTD